MDISETEQALNAEVALALLLRKTETHMTFAQIASASNLSERTVKRYLHGEREVGVGALVTLARAMGTTAQAILVAAEEAIGKNSK